MNIIVSVDKNGGIGRDGELLVRIKRDMKRFRELTLGGVVIMGRKTFVSLPNASPLKDRVNIVLTRGGFSAEGVLTAHSVEELFSLLERYPDREHWVIGGESVYKQLLPYCDRAYITRICGEYAADAFFSEFANGAASKDAASEDAASEDAASKDAAPKGWRQVYRSRLFMQGETPFFFENYRRSERDV